MKAKLAILCACGLGAIVGFYGLSRPVTAQQPGGGPAVVARTRVAVVNLQEVMKAYPKYDALQQELKKKDEFYVGKLKAMDANLKALADKLQNPNTPATDKVPLQQQYALAQLEMKRTGEDAKAELIKFHDENMVKIYWDVDKVVRDYCAANGIDLVFRFNEDWNKENYAKPDYVIRRLSMPFWPMYFDPDLNITFRVSDILKRQFQANGGQGAVIPAGNNQPANPQ